MAETLKGGQVTGTARNARTTDLKTKYEAGESIRAWPGRPGARGFVRMLSESGVRYAQARRCHPR